MLTEEQDGIAVLEVIFDTAWGPPFPVIKEIANRFPRLMLTLGFFDEMWNFAGQHTYVHGQLIDEIKIDMDDEVSANSFARKVYGENGGRDES